MKAAVRLALLSLGFPLLLLGCGGVADTGAGGAVLGGSDSAAGGDAGGSGSDGQAGQTFGGHAGSVGVNGGANSGGRSAGASSMTSGTVTLGKVSRIASGKVEMTVDVALGGRILTFQMGDQNLLLEAKAVAGTENANNFGASFWPSPQSAWGWPPIAAIDSEPYRAELSGNALALTSNDGKLLDGGVISLSKRFQPVSGKDAIDVTYQLENKGSVAVTLATWQIARVRANGLTFFRLGEGGVGSDKLATVTLGGVQWYAYDAAVVVAQGQKTFADAKGWVAHVEGELVFVQSYPDVAPGEAAEGEAELELYADPSHTYVEIEPQGRAVTIAPGARGPAWTVRFFLAKLPSSLQPNVGSTALVAFVESLIRG